MAFHFKDPCFNEHSSGFWDGWKQKVATMVRKELFKAKVKHNRVLRQLNPEARRLEQQFQPGPFFHCPLDNA